MIFPIIIALSAAVLPDTLFKNGFDPTGCPATITVDHIDRQLVRFAAVGYGVAYMNHMATLSIGEWSEVWGRSAVGGPPLPFPAVAGSAPVFKGVPRTGYLAHHFKTPATLNGMVSYVRPVEVGGPNITMAISTICGDFTERLPTPGCLQADVSTGASTKMGLMHFHVPGLPDNPNTTCLLQPNTDYYQMEILTDPASTGGSPGHPACAASASVCNVTAWRG